MEETLAAAASARTSDGVAARAAALFEEHHRGICKRADRLFAGLMVVQWIAAIAAALWITPRTWVGQYSQVHLHVWAAIGMGGAITLFPVAMAIYRAGATSTRYVIAASQMLMSALLIDLTGGRIETHFHVFGSLALLAFYRDWRVYIPATLVVAADHFFRGVYWPLSVFGVITASPWRWIEHAGWVLFENAFLIRSCIQSVREMKDIAWQRAELEATNDIVEKKVQERTRDLRHATELAETASNAKSIFLATMSHEIRTPMNGILGMTELVLETELTREQRDSLGLVKLSAESLLVVINDVLDFSKIEAGKLDVEPLPFDLRECVAETMNTLGLRAHQKGLELVYDVQPDVPDALIGDAGRIRQILVNLVGNGIKFTEQGEILVTVSRQADSQEPGALHFSVRDTGIGIPREKQAKIFEAFSQADGSMTRRYGGTGLGLTICSRLVSILGGRIWVESEPGHGSTLHFTCSFGIQQSASPAAAPIHAKELQGMHALIVDDNYTNRRVLEATLTRWGMKPTAVEGGKSALLALEVARNAGHPFPLVLLDGQMPEVDGFTLAQQIQRNPHWVGATIMMLTSADHVGDGARCREIGIAGYLVKPIRQSELLEAICLVLAWARGELVKADEAAPAEVSTKEMQGVRVLLVEDNKVNQTLALRLLEKQGFHVSVAPNGQAALGALAQGAFDVVLMDVQMPVMDGFEATQRIRDGEQATGVRMPVIAMTAHALKGDRERCLAAGMDGYITKPIRGEELFAAIEEALSRKGGFASSLDRLGTVSANGTIEANVIL